MRKHVCVNDFVAHCNKRCGGSSVTNFQNVERTNPPHTHTRALDLAGRTLSDACFFRRTGLIWMLCT